MQADTDDPLRLFRSRAEDILKNAALLTDGFLDLETLLRSHTAPSLTCIALYLLVAAAFWPRSSPDPRSLQNQFCTSPAEVAQLLYSNFTECSDLGQSLAAEWSQLVSAIQALALPRQHELVRFVAGCAPGDACSLDGCLEEIATRLYRIVHSIRSRNSLSGNVAVGTNDSVAPSHPPPEPVCPPAPVAPRQQPAAASPRKTRSGNSYSAPSAASLKAATRLPKEAKKKRAARTSSTRKAQNVSSSITASSINPVKPEDTLTWAAISPPMRNGSMATATVARFPPSRQPHIWAATRQELSHILPEFGHTHIVFGNTETPVLFLEGPSWEHDRWDGGRTIELSLVSKFTRRVPGFAAGPDGGRIPQNTAAKAIPQTAANSRFDRPLPHPPVIERGHGVYFFAPEVSPEPRPIGGAVESGPPPPPPPPVPPDNVPSRAEHTAMEVEDPFPTVVLNADGTYRFIEEDSPADIGRVAPMPAPVPSSVPAPVRLPSPGMTYPAVDLAALSPTEPPAEIGALLLSREASIPVNIVLCRNAALSPLILPDGCGCTFLGFFLVTDVQERIEDLSSETLPGAQPITLVYGRKSWRFRFEWTPGGEDPDSLVAPNPTPWWARAADPPDRGNEADAAAPSQHPYTLLPLHFLAAPAQFVSTDADVQAWRGWRCDSCGRLNLQLNLCYQLCGSCSTSNGLPPIAVEYVRQVRGTDPIAFPSDRYPESVPCASVDGPEDLRRFTYALNKKAIVHHLFTCNRATVQAEPSQLFADLQAEVELASELSAKSKAGGVGPYYSCTFSRPSKDATRSGAFWVSSVPASVSRARELMLRRVHQLPVRVGLKIDSLSISGWRSAGNKRGCVFLAEKLPLVVLCLGADVELTFWRQKAAAISGVLSVLSSGTAGARARISNRPTNVSSEPVFLTGGVDATALDEPLVDKGHEDIDGADVTFAGETTVPSGLGRGQTTSKGKGRATIPKKDLEEALMVTLVHGDLLVVHGAVFEYSIKRTGMSIVLFGQ